MDNRQLISFDCGSGTTIDIYKDHIIGFTIGFNDLEDTALQKYEYILALLTTNGMDQVICGGTAEECRNALDNIYLILEPNVISV